MIYSTNPHGSIFSSFIWRFWPEKVKIFIDWNRLIIGSIRNSRIGAVAVRSGLDFEQLKLLRALVPNFFSALYLIFSKTTFNEALDNSKFIKNLYLWIGFWTWLNKLLSLFFAISQRIHRIFFALMGDPEHDLG